MREAFRGLRGRFLLLVIAIYAAVGIASLLGFYRVAQSIIHTLGVGYATQYANQQRSRILAKVERELVLTQKLVSSPLLVDWAQDEHNPQLKAQAMQELESYRRIFADHSWFFVVTASHDYYTNNAQNEFGGHEFRFVEKEDDPTMRWYFETLKHVDTFELHPDYDAQLDVTKLFINAIARDAAGRKIAVAGTGLDLSGFIHSIVRTGDAGVENLLINDDGFVQGHSSAAVMQSIAHNHNDKTRLQVYALVDDPAQRDELRDALAGMKAGQTTDLRTELTVGGQKRIAAISYMPELHWAAIVLVDPSQVIRLQMFRPILILLAAALLLTILLVSWLLERLVLTRLARLTRLTHDIAAGQYDRTLEVDREDEIGQLTHSFNTMTRTVGDYMLNLEQKVADRTEALRSANERLAESNRQVMDSIRYARLIQSSILSKPEDLDALLPAHAMLWLPRDVVGGDFHCLYRRDDGGFLLAVADCTGHGVPGAFMTMASKALLDHAVSLHGMEHPAAVLGELHRGLRALLQNRYASDAESGLDLALVHVPADRSRLVFAGAKLPLWVVDGNGEVVVLKGDRQSVGYRRHGDDLAYSEQSIATRDGERYVLTTDGILDQHGGDRGFALGQARLKALLREQRARPLADLADAVAQMLASYRGSLPQRDDITFLAFAFALDRGAGAS
ncbi:MAG: SpoIIE family protein phosphatase [Proteobacteria bacterium]|nr:SpoIIE family protein phosphatase [Pseudomonadota bacterium]